ncbi:alpha amylase C-terminal domain-containing protein [Flavobacterium sp.]|uniref:alpha amylase C-terminal domain-containing protein n=1 Tax=Flavobacterium sp. TaxID=239 RepID=UPI0037BF8445
MDFIAFFRKDELVTALGITFNEKLSFHFSFIGNNRFFYLSDYLAIGFSNSSSTKQQKVSSNFRRGQTQEKENLITVCNMTLVIHEKYRIGLPNKVKLTEIFNSDKIEYNIMEVTFLNSKPINIEKIRWNGKAFSAEIIWPP